MFRVAVVAAVSAALAASAPALATTQQNGPSLSPSPAAPKSCGPTKSGTYLIRVGARTSCSFGRKTVKAFDAALSANHGALNDKLGQEAGGAFNFTLKVSRTEVMDCRANGLAHDEFDIYCNDLNRYRRHVVDLVNRTEP